MANRAQRGKQQGCAPAEAVKRCATAGKAVVQKYTGRGKGIVSRRSRVSNAAPSWRSGGCRLRPRAAGSAAAARGCAAGLNVDLPLTRLLPVELPSQI